MKRIALFSGSFNPVHIGHLALANWICEYEDMDEVWFLVTPQSPMKMQSGMMDAHLRLDYVKRSIAGYPKFKASDFEFAAEQPSYTVDTLRRISEAWPDDEFHFVIGADNWVTFDKWKNYREIIEKYRIIIYPRLGYNVAGLDGYANVRMAPAPVIEISSRFIRQALLEGKDVRFFLPEAIREEFFSCETLGGG
jgi:nicotinate-nucleotide adenylyltransferase